MNSHPTPVSQRPFKDNKLKVTFSWMYGQRDGKFMIRMIRHKNPNANINFNFSFF